MYINNVYAVYLLCLGIKVIIILLKTKKISYFAKFAHHQLNEKRHPDTLLHHPRHLCLIHLQYLSCFRKQIDIINCDVGKYHSQSAHECLSPLTLTHLLRGATL